MKLKLTQAGFEKYNGQMGVIFFEAGLSTKDVILSDAIRMSAVMLCEWENGTKPSVAQSLLDNANTPAPVFKSGESGQHDVEKSEKKQAVSEVKESVSNLHTAESLGAIADAQGIKGLREIGDKLGVKGNSINDLIEDLIAAGAKVE